MKNLVVTFLLALLVVLTAISVRRMVAGSATSRGQSLPPVAIGTMPVPPLVAIGTMPVPPLAVGNEKSTADVR